MPLFMDRHDLPGASAAEVAAAHVRDLEVQERYGVNFLTYWFDDKTGCAFCLAEAPDKEGVQAVHDASHGLLPANIVEVDEGSIRGFLGQLQQHPAGEPYMATAFRAILFTDIEDSTRLTQELGDVAAMRLIRAHDEIVRGALERSGGSEVKHTGDGIMAAFPSASRAIEAALIIQGELEQRDESERFPLRVRIGIAAGEPVTEHDDLFGAAVQLAARLCACGEAGRVVVSSAIRDLCHGKGFQFTDRGSVELKGFEEPVGHFEVSGMRPVG